MITTRTVLGMLGVLCIACGLATGGEHAHQPFPRIPSDTMVNGFFIGCQAYTFNRFTAFEAIEKTAQAGGKVIEFYPGQRLSKEQPDVRVGHDMPVEAIVALKTQCARHGIKPVNYGVVGIPRDEASARKIFQFAVLMDMYAVTTESTDAIDTIEKLVKEYNIACAFHNHPRRPNDPNYKVWDPNTIMEVCKGRDPRIGACADTGHWIRSGLTPVECLRILRGRIVSCHLKDLNRMAPNAHDVPFGKGVADIKACLDELKAQGFRGNISIEYEHNWDNSLPEVTECVQFVASHGK